MQLVKISTSPLLSGQFKQVMSPSVNETLDDACTAWRVSCRYYAAVRQPLTLTKCQRAVISQSMNGSKMSPCYTTACMRAVHVPTPATATSPSRRRRRRRHATRSDRETTTIARVDDVLLQGDVVDGMPALPARPIFNIRPS